MAEVVEECFNVSWYVHIYFDTYIRALYCDLRLLMPACADGWLAWLFGSSSLLRGTTERPFSLAILRSQGYVPEQQAICHPKWVNVIHSHIYHFEFGICFNGRCSLVFSWPLNPFYVSRNGRQFKCSVLSCLNRFKWKLFNIGCFIWSFFVHADYACILFSPLPCNLRFKMQLTSHLWKWWISLLCCHVRPCRWFLLSN